MLVAVPILIMFPLLFLSVLKQKWYPYFFKLARIWAKIILIGMGYYWTVMAQSVEVTAESTPPETPTTNPFTFAFVAYVFSHSTI